MRRPFSTTARGYSDSPLEKLGTGERPFASFLRSCARENAQAWLEDYGFRFETGSWCRTRESFAGFQLP